jgi:uridine kinase
VVLLAGPSGCGKTTLALATGHPVVALDDFYREGTDPGLPHTPDGRVDWEDVRSWDVEAATAAVEALCTHRRTELPTYAFGEDRVVGRRTLAIAPNAPLVIAEGLFAADLIEPLRERGRLAEALLIHDGRWRTFARRLRRDLGEGRKSRSYLVRQGIAKARAQPRVVAALRAKGARPVSKAEARASITALAKLP